MWVGSEWVECGECVGVGVGSESGECEWECVE